MKTKLFILLLAAFALTACKDDSAVFYTTTYPVLRVEAQVTVTETPVDPEPENPDPETPDPENPDPENPDPENPTPETTQQEDPEPENPDPENPTPETTQQEDPEPENPLIQEIKDNVLATAPVQAGGRYVLDFTLHNGGLLIVYPTADGQPQNGTFVKEPDKPEILQFAFGGLSYTCTASNYLDGALYNVVLTVDLTAQYKALYPDAGITKVVRQEYTSHSN